MRRRFVVAILFIGWLANYLHSTGFGYYEDDWYYFVSARVSDPAALFATMWGGVIHFFQGRPLQVVCEFGFGYLGAIFGLYFLYVLSFLASSVATVLLYRVLRLKFPFVYAATAALLFVLSPLTTVRQHLNCMAMAPFAFSCVFGAILLYRVRPKTSYLLAVASLLTYESVFFLFLAAPAFARGRWTGRRRRKGIIHVLVCLLVLCAYLVVRYLYGEGRLMEAGHAGAVAALTQPAATGVLAALQSFRAYWYSITVSWKEASLEACIYALAALLPTLLLLWRKAARAGGAGRMAEVRAWWWIRNGFGTGFAVLLLGSVTLYFQMPGAYAFPLAGRDTRFALTATVGSSMCVASVLMLLLALVQKSWLRAGLKGVFLAVFSAAFVYSFVIQEDYVRAWRYERNFFTQLVALTPDLQPDTLLVVRAGADPQPGFGPKDRTPSIGTQRHGLQDSLQCLANYVPAPRIYFANSDDWERELAPGPDGKLHWARNGIWGASLTTGYPITPGHIIVLDQSSDGLLNRRHDRIAIPPAQTSEGVPKPSAWASVDASGILAEVVDQPARSILLPAGEVTRELKDADVVVEAERFFSGENVVADGSAFGAGIGVVVSPKSPAQAEYTIYAPTSGRYRVFIRYASEEARPILLYVNGRLITAEACSAPSGGYDPGHQVWQAVGNASFGSGANTLRLVRNGPFPAIDKIALKRP